MDNIDGHSMKHGGPSLDTRTGQGIKQLEATVTRAQRDEVVADIIGRYGGCVGEMVVNDDGALARLLTTLQLDESDTDVGEYLCSYLVA